MSIVFTEIGAQLILEPKGNDNRYHNAYRVINCRCKLTLNPEIRKYDTKD